MNRINMLKNAQTMITNSIVKTLVIASLVGSLGGCAALVVGGVVAGATMVATDRRTSGSQLNDEGIEIRANNRLKEKFGERGNC
jgi:osmotically-inducible protein OsmY